MDWRNNAWVGIGAAGLLVLVIIVAVWRIAGGGSSPLEEATVGMWYECDACGGHFKVEMTELQDYEVYSTYMERSETAVPCRLCGEVAAYKAYYCPTCEKWYRYTRAQDTAAAIFCPEGHAIPEEWQ